MVIAGTYGADGAEYRTERQSLAKAQSFGSAGSGPAWFRMWTKSGQILEYGNSASSSIEAQGIATVRTWMVNKISDTVGNFLSLSYIEDNANGDFRPDRIEYNGATPGQSVQFVYEDRTDIPAACVGGSVIKTMRRLSRVTTRVGTAAVAEYRLTYDQVASLGKTRLRSIKECDSDLPGATCKPATSLDWTVASTSHFADRD
ncbi:MAG: hypothetical protein IT529_13965, partial [Burkholderiales bacterium]|nr:hypothetical protein [Burkholderiales bacterium]